MIPVNTISKDLKAGEVFIFQHLSSYGLLKFTPPPPSPCQNFLAHHVYDKKVRCRNILGKLCHTINYMKVIYPQVGQAPLMIQHQLQDVFVGPFVEWKVVAVFDVAAEVELLVSNHALYKLNN